MAGGLEALLERQADWVGGGGRERVERVVEQDIGDGHGLAVVELQRAVGMEDDEDAVAGGLCGPRRCAGSSLRTAAGCASRTVPLNSIG